MRMKNLFVPTMRTIPSEAETISHKLLLKAGFIRKLSAGVYTYLPLAQRTLRKISAIVREEMDSAEGQEILMPAIQPSELWKESGRWDVYGDELFRLQDRHDRFFCLGPTHEEIVTDLVRGELSSYKQLPLRLYQIQTKFRDERRPRFGLMRGREFIMKDLYSFDENSEGLDISYEAMYSAYENIFTRCGLTFRAVSADSGSIGGNSSHEFMVLADSGEDAISFCSSCSFAANVEIAEAVPQIGAEEEQMPLEKVYTPGMKTIAAVSEYLDLDVRKTAKILFYRADGKLVAVVLRGDRTLNELKLAKVLDAENLEMAGENEVSELTGAGFGSLGPVGLTGVPVYADREIEFLTNGCYGANEDDYHFLNVNSGRDFVPEGYFDFRNIEEGDVCPDCGGRIEIKRGIEVGHVFKLEKKYSEPLKTVFLDSNGKEQTVWMGCYGIGISRTMAAAVEQNYDEDGIVWPAAIAPYHCIVIPVSEKDSAQVEEAEKIYSSLLAAGTEAVLDDRKERPGVKFKDADLIGFPVKIIVGKKTVSEGTVEIVSRREQVKKIVSKDEAVRQTLEILADN